MWVRTSLNQPELEASRPERHSMTIHWPLRYVLGEIAVLMSCGEFTIASQTMATTIHLDWSLDDSPLQVVRALRAAGHEAWLAGGCVRDLLLGTSPKDHDIATSASPAQVASVFRRTIPVQPELGVTLVLWKENRLEVTTFRTEGPYLDGRRPTRVGPATSSQDVQRRDFTVNGLLLDPETGEVVDHVGGLEDLRGRVLRCIGSPDERFEEDHLRILRAIRFAVRLDFRIDAPTWDAMARLSDHLERLSGERIRDELDRMFAQGPFARCLEMLLDSGAMGALFPDLAKALEPAASRRRLIQLCSGVPATIAGSWVALLGMPLCSWWNAPWEFGPVAALHPGHNALLETLKCSRAEGDAARLVWQRWPNAWAPSPRAPSSISGLVRDRSFGCLVGLVELSESTLQAPWSASALLKLELARIPSALPALGETFQSLGIPRGPKLGEAIRLADRRMLDEGREADPELLRQVVLTILGAP